MFLQKWQILYIQMCARLGINHLIRAPITKIKSLPYEYISPTGDLLSLIFLMNFKIEHLFIIIYLYFFNFLNEFKSL